MGKELILKEIILNGRIISSRDHVEGEAIVTGDPIAFGGSIDLNEGIISEPGHKLRGESIADKILVFPTGKGPTSDPYGFYFLKKNGKAPKAIINITANPTTLVGAIISDVPFVYQLDKNPLKIIQTGDHVKLDAREGTLTVIKGDRN